MNTLLIILLGLIPVAAVLVIAFLFLKKEGQKEKYNLQLELTKQRQEFFLPSRLEAYQRAVLLLERIHPNSLVMRLHNPGMPAKMMQAEFLKAIREEYDHNVAQQLFISPLGWKMVREAKEETIKIINIAGSQLEATATGMELSSKILELVAEIGELPNEIVVEQLKSELQGLF
ncbi:MAG: hypothetical protein KA521_10745 [Crocinitomicaceae bacterium]|nr:hypothetical protein [Crocinitomicaceae bacterium]